MNHAPVHPNQGPGGDSGDSEALRRLYVVERLSHRQIADRLGLSQSTVSRRLRDHGITWPEEDRERPPAFPIPDGINEEHRRELTYTNAEIERERRRERTEPTDLIRQRGREILDQHLRRRSGR